MAPVDTPTGVAPEPDILIPTCSEHTSVAPKPIIRETEEFSELNSYKYAKPRIYVKNEFPDTDIHPLDRIREISLLIGSKERPESYNEKINSLLAISQRKNAKLRRKSL